MGYCFCEECEMSRPLNATKSEEPREGGAAIELVSFKDPSKLFGKKIGMAVYNTEQNSSADRNTFKIALTNAYGYQLFP